MPVVSRASALLVFSVLFIAMFQPAKANEAQPSPKSTCEQPESWLEWNKLLAKHPGDMDLRALHALRVGLCVQVASGKLSVDEGTAIFERACKVLIQRAARPRAELKSKL